MYIHTHIVCFEGKKYVLRGKKFPTAMRRVAESACACARTHACTCAEREGEREGEAGRESQWGGRKRESGAGGETCKLDHFRKCAHARARASKHTTVGGGSGRAPAGRTVAAACGPHILRAHAKVRRCPSVHVVASAPSPAKRCRGGDGSARLRISFAERGSPCECTRL